MIKINCKLNKIINKISLNILIWIKSKWIKINKIQPIIKKFPDGIIGNKDIKKVDSIKISS